MVSSFYGVGSRDLVETAVLKNCLVSLGGVEVGGHASEELDYCNGIMTQLAQHV